MAAVLYRGPKRDPTLEHDPYGVLVLSGFRAFDSFTCTRQARPQDDLSLQGVR